MPIENARNVEPTPDPIEELLFRWEEAREQGSVLSLDDLCKDRPDLRAIVAAKIDALVAFDEFFETAESNLDTTSQSPLETAPSNRPVPLDAIPGFEILEEIGRGGIGVVYKARQSALDRIVALKVILAGGHATEQSRIRFQTEAKAAARFVDPNVVQIFHIDDHGGVPYLVLEYVPGGNLRERLSKESISPQTAGRLVEKLTGVVQRAHEAGVLHRDLKPANILLAGPEGAPIGECEPKLSDFGLAHLFQGEQRMTEPGTAWGTPAYMAPEQALGETDRTDKPTVDIWGLGAILYELLAGKPPFLGPTSFRTIRLVVDKDPVRPSEWNPSVPQALEAICLKCLHKDPDKRYQSAAELQSALSDFVSTNQRPAKPTIAEQRPTRRWPVWFAAFACGFLLAAGVLGWSIWNRSPTQPNQAGGGSAAAVTAMPTHVPAIRIGALFSLTGSTAESEAPVVDTIHLAVREINAAGGLLGRPIELVLADGHSAESRFAEQAEKLIRTDHVDAIVGCYMSADRKSVIPVIERYNHLLLYPVPFEGLEESPYVIYTGSVPNQRSIQAINWCRSFLSANTFYLLGGENIWSRGTAEVIKDRLKELKAAVVGETYLAPDMAGMQGAIESIESARPDVTILILGGDPLISFIKAVDDRPVFESLKKLVIHPGKHAVRTLGLERVEGTYFATNYVETIDSPENQRFLSLFRSEQGRQQIATDAMESAYVAVHLWAQAVATARTADPVRVRDALLKQSFEAPGGPVRVDPESHCIYKTARVGRVGEGGTIKLEYISPEPLRPEPFPATRTRAEWEAFLKEYFHRWGDRWSISRD